MMMDGRVVLDDIVSQVGSSSLPVSVDSVFIDFAANPKELHVHGFGLFWLHGVRDNAKGCVVNLDWSGWLGMTHFFKKVLMENGFMGIDV